MRKRVVILDGGTGGTLAANRLRRELPDDVTNLFFTFFGLDAIHQARHEHIKLAAGGQIIFT